MMTRGEKNTFHGLLEQLGAKLPLNRQRQQQQQQQQRQKQQQQESSSSTTAEQTEPKTETQAQTQTQTQTQKQDQQENQVPDEYMTEISKISSIFDAVLKETRWKKASARTQPAQDSELMLEKFKSIGGGRGPLVTSDRSNPVPKAELRQIAQVRNRLRRFKESNVDLSKIQLGGQVRMEKAVGMVVQREAAKIESSLLNCVKFGSGDLGMWEVCRDRIFTMMQYLEQEDSGSDNNQKSTTMTSQSGESPQLQPPQPQPEPEPIEEEEEEKEDQEDQENHHNNDNDNDNPQKATSAYPPSETLDIPPFIPPKPVITTLYPKMLLTAFRLLTTCYPTSPLISQFRSSIRAHGAASTIAGSSVDLYDDLLEFYWVGCSDLPGVVSLLREMEVTGVEPDERTVGVLRGIVRERDEDVGGGGGGGGRGVGKGRGRKDRGFEGMAWWDMGPNREVIRELTSPGGWIERLDERVRRSMKS